MVWGLVLEWDARECDDNVIFLEREPVETKVWLNGYQKEEIN